MTAASADPESRKLARHNIAAGIVLVAIAGFFFATSFQISIDFVDEEGIGPRFFPQAISIVLGALGLITAILGIMGNTAPTDSTKFDLHKLLHDALPLFAIGIAFVWLFGAFGFLAAIILLLVAALLVYGVKGKAMYLTALITGVALYLIFFKLMRVFEPTATIFNPLSLVGLG